MPANPYQPSPGVFTDAPGFAATGSSVPPGTIEALRQTRPWVLFLAVIGALFTGILLLLSLGMLAGGAFAPSTIDQADDSGTQASLAKGMLLLGGVLYLFFAALYLYPVVKLFKYAGAIRALALGGAAADLENALRQQKSFWKFTGILVILGIVAYIASLAFVIAG